MTTGQLLRTLRQVPFHPFVIHLVDGRQLEVRHPEMVIFAGGGRIANVQNREGLLESIDVLMIVSLRPHGRLRLRPRAR